MNLTGCLRCFGSLSNGPRTALILTCRQEGNQTEKIIALGDQAIQPALSDAHLFKEHLLFFLVHLRNILFNFRGDHKHLCIFCCCNLTNSCNAWKFILRFPKIIFLYIAGVNDRLCREQEPLLRNLLFTFSEFACTNRLEIIQMRKQLLSQGCLFLYTFFTALEKLCRFFGALCNRFAICRNQLKVDGFNVVLRICTVRMADDVRILKAADNMYNGLAFTNMRKELVPKALTMAGSLYKTCNIHKFNDSRCFLFGGIHLCKFIQAFIRNSNDTCIRFNGAKRIVRCLCTGLCDCIKQC